MTDRQRIRKWVADNFVIDDSPEHSEHLVNYILGNRIREYRRGYRDGFHAGYAVSDPEHYQPSNRS